MEISLGGFVGKGPVEPIHLGHLAYDYEFIPV
jgi:hypothetical protein